jgi:hypothetical protein
MRISVTCLLARLSRARTGCPLSPSADDNRPTGRSRRRPVGGRRVPCSPKQQLLIRKRAPNLHLSDRIVAGVCPLLVRPGRLVPSAIVLKPATLFRLSGSHSRPCERHPTNSTLLARRRATGPPYQSNGSGLTLEKSRSGPAMDTNSFSAAAPKSWLWQIHSSERKR